MSPSRLISPQALTICGVALLACAGCRTREPAVILSPEYQIPNPYVAPRTATVIHQPAATIAPAYQQPVAPVIQQEEPVAVTPIAVHKDPIVPIVVPKVPSAPKISLEPLTPVAVHQGPKRHKPIIESLPERGGTWVVKKGDSLWAIGRRYGVAVQDLAAANGVSTKSLLKIGQRLRIPEDGWKPAAPKQTTAQPPSATIVHAATNEAPSPANTSTNGFYVVASGDSLWKIARAHNTTVADLKALNGLSSTVLQPGQKLKVQGVTYDESEAVKVSDAPKQEIPAIRNNIVAMVTAPTGATSPAPTSPKMRVLPHYVAPGDSVRSIAMLYDADEDAIRKKNPQVKDFSRLVPGTRIEVPLAPATY